jgi:ion channel
VPIRSLSPWGAVRAIAATTLLTTLVSGALIHVVDRKEFPTLGSGMWWAIQTVTSVGYGDLVPEAIAGRVVAVFVMLTGIAFLTVATAAISARLIHGLHLQGDDVTAARVERLFEQLEALEAQLRDRHAECSTLDALLSGSHVATLVLRGAVGSGKTALLGYAARHAAGRRVLRASGVAAESELAWAGLHQLLGVPALPPDPMQSGIALLEALSETAEREPLLCLVDDAQLLDDQSLAALAFAARRLPADRVVLLLTASPSRIHCPSCGLRPSTASRPGAGSTSASATRCRRSCATA